MDVTSRSTCVPGLLNLSMAAFLSWTEWSDRMDKTCRPAICRQSTTSLWRMLASARGEVLFETAGSKSAMGELIAGSRACLPWRRRGWAGRPGRGAAVASCWAGQGGRWGWGICTGGTASIGDASLSASTPDRPSGGSRPIPHPRPWGEPLSGSGPPQCPSLRLRGRPDGGLGGGLSGSWRSVAVSLGTTWWPLPGLRSSVLESTAWCSAGWRRGWLDAGQLWCWSFYRSLGLLRSGESWGPFCGPCSAWTRWACRSSRASGPSSSTRCCMWAGLLAWTVCSRRGSTRPWGRLLDVPTARRAAAAGSACLASRTAVRRLA